MVAIIKPGQGERSTGREGNRVICIATLNVRFMRGRSNEIVEMLSRRQVDICCLQEDGEVNQLGKLQGQIRISSFSGKEIIIAMEV